MLGVALLVAAPVAQAQVKSPSKPARTGAATARAPQPRDGLFIADGATWLALHGTAGKISAPVKLGNGGRVTPSGVVEMPDGRRIALRPGQLVTMAGEILTLRAPQVSYRMAVRPLEGILVSHGRAYLIRGGQMNLLQGPVRLQTGVVVDPGGLMRMPDGTSSQLGNGQLLTFSGRIRDPGGNPAGDSPIRSYPSKPGVTTTGESQTMFTGNVEPNPPQLPGQGTASD